MPYYPRKYKRTGRKRYWRRAKKLKYKKKFSKPSVKVLKRGTIIPDRYFCKMRYTSTIDLRPSVASPQSRQVFRGNSLYDPDATSTGAQPLGFDQLSSLYQKYRVYASSIKVQIMPLSTTSGSFAKYALYPTSNSSNDVGTDPAAEHPYAKNTFVAGSGQTFRMLKNFMTTKRILGYKSINTQESLVGTPSSNPITQWYWILDYGTVGGVNNLDPGYLNFTVTYYCEFFDRVDLTGS